MENEKSTISISKEQANSLNLHKIYTAEIGNKIGENLKLVTETLETIKKHTTVLNALVESTDRLVKENSHYLIVSDK